MKDLRINEMKIDEIREFIMNMKDFKKYDENNDIFILDNSKLERFRYFIEKNENSLELLKNKKKESEYFLFKKEDSKIKKNIILKIENISQNHERKDKDIKILSFSENNFRIKLIYHRMKNNEKEFRIFLSFKDENQKLKRIRIKNQNIQKIQNDEKKMIEYSESLKKYKNYSDLLKKEG